MLLHSVRFLNGGYCIQNEYFVGLRQLGWRRFQAVFIHFFHPIHGQCLIDTGYGPNVFNAMGRLPAKAMRWLLPIPKGQMFQQEDYLERQAIDPRRISNIFVSHFHADHIGGLSLFPNSRFIIHESSFEELRQMTTFQQVQHGFVRGLLPNNFQAQCVGYTSSSFTRAAERFAEFETFDYWGDGSLILIELPGHALGHIGFLLNSTAGPILYVVDAFWDRQVFLDQKPLPWLSKKLQHSGVEYTETQRKLKRMVDATGLVPIACHCPLTQANVAK